MCSYILFERIVSVVIIFRSLKAGLLEEMSSIKAINDQFVPGLAVVQVSCFFMRVLYFNLRESCHLRCVLWRPDFFSFVVFR